MFAKTSNGAKCLESYGRIQAGAVVPSTNELYQDVQAWLDAGNDWHPLPPAPVFVPQTMTARQARLALLATGKLSDVPAAINSLPSPQKEQAEIEWEYASSIERSHPFITALGAALGLSNAEIDQLFIDGVEL